MTRIARLRLRAEIIAASAAIYDHCTNCAVCLLAEQRQQPQLICAYGWKLHKRVRAAKEALQEYRDQLDAVRRKQQTLF